MGALIEVRTSPAEFGGHRDARAARNYVRKHNVFRHNVSMDFLDRRQEMRRLERLRRSSGGGLGVLWGRRRVGKTRLLVEWCRRHRGLYVVADQSSQDVQRRFFAEA